MMPKILLVEDNELNRDMLSRRLQRCGFSVVPAGDGQSAVTVAQLENPDLILMDMSLPLLDGWEATRLIKTNVATRHIPVIALTAHAMASDSDRAFAVGCDDYDTKPVEFARLLQKMARLLGTATEEATSSVEHNGDQQSTRDAPHHDHSSKRSR